MSENSIGRPTVFTPETITKLEEAFLKDFTDLEACLYAGISKSALYDYQKANPDFAERKELLKQNIAMKAKTLIADNINSGEVADGKWWLERRRRDEFSVRQEQTGKDGTNLIPVVNLTIGTQSKPTSETE